MSEVKALSEHEEISLMTKDHRVGVIIQQRDEALSQLAASLATNGNLSAELAWSENDSRDQSKEIAALREELATAENACRITVEECRKLVYTLTEVRQRLADAERRNATITTLLREGLEEYKNGDDWIDRVIAALRNQPTESGASE